MSVQFQSQNFQHILRCMCNTNVDGRQKVMFALTAIRGMGRRISNIVCKKCDIDLNKRAGELTTDEVNKIVAVVSKPLEVKIPAWMLDGKTSQKYANFLDQALREPNPPSQITVSSLLSVTRLRRPTAPYSRGLSKSPRFDCDYRQAVRSLMQRELL
eukprot:Skav230836  [mRNA]  locus=scaffold3471:37777:40945:+ [translate_table: standard]